MNRRSLLVATACYLTLAASACGARIEQVDGVSGTSADPSVARAGATASGEAISSYGGSDLPASGSAPTPPESSALPASSSRVITVLSTAPKFPVSLATYGGNVYFVDFGSFSNDGAAYGVSANGAQLFRVGDLQGPGGIAASSSGVYWAAASNLVRAELDGSNAVTLSNSFVNDPIALGPDGLYGTGSVGNAGGIVGIRLGQTSTLSLTATVDSSYGLAADAERVYWTTFRDPMSIHSVPIAGGKPVTLATSPGPGGAIAIDAHSAYWVAHGAVMKVSLDGGAPTQLASAAPSAFISGIAVDGRSVYWSSADSIMKVPVEGGAAEVLATGQNAPAAVAVDDTSVYWATVGNPTGMQGSISRLTPK